ncbi:amidase [Leucobacter sp. OH1287]|uniref:amidase n=1 Tax=Leucobacter sp. OH1287 TaxID=2491049 RepID=UPI000F602BDC|nr:amidase [Leucobacter sp. OH1287]RRD60510.1 amidase [Leucobacter sp. OH1287]
MTQATHLNLYEISIDELLNAYREEQLSAVAVVARYLNRIGAFDRSAAAINAVIALNPEVFAQAAESDRRWAAGNPRPLEGVPFTVKDSYMVQGLTVASGSPAFAGLVAQWDAFSVAQLKAAGAVLIGKTNMPPMADGGMQRGVYGRAENPYNTAYLAAAYASGSSNGSGAATAANFAVFGMGEETVSSGRSPASNNGLCAYTPSWGIISIRGNWPLFPARDVVVPHTRSIPDMLHVLNALVADDDNTRGDFWRHQRVVAIPPASTLRPADYTELLDEHALRGKTLAVPRMYLGKDPNFPIAVRDSVLTLWEQTRKQLESLGATVVESNFPLIEQYEGDKPAGENIDRLGVLPDDWMATEFNHFLAFGWDDFLRANGDPAIPDLASVNPDTIFPLWEGTLPDRYDEVPDYENRYRAVVAYAKEGIADPRDNHDFAAGLNALVSLRETLFENWLTENGYDAVVFPANADVGAADSESDQQANDHTWTNGVLFSNGNYALRHLGIPSVTVTMGQMADTGVPVGVTFAGAAYQDAKLLSYAGALDAASERPTPQFAPEQDADIIDLADARRAADGAGAAGGAGGAAAGGAGADPAPSISISGGENNTAHNGAIAVTVWGEVTADSVVEVTVNGTALAVDITDEKWHAFGVLPPQDSGINPEQPLLVVATASALDEEQGGFAADFCEVEL